MTIKQFIARAILFVAAMFLLFMAFVVFLKDPGARAFITFIVGFLAVIWAWHNR